MQVKFPGPRFNTEARFHGLDRFDKMFGSRKGIKRSKKSPRVPTTADENFLVAMKPCDVERPAKPKSVVVPDAAQKFLQQKRAQKDKRGGRRLNGSKSQFCRISA